MMMVKTMKMVIDDDDNEGNVNRQNNNIHNDLNAYV